MRIHLLHKKILAQICFSCQENLYYLYMTPQLNELLKQTSRSLYLSARQLPPAARDTFAVAYLLCRYADSIADTALLPPTRRLHWIQRFAQMITHPQAQEQTQLVQEISGASENKYEEQLLKNFPLCLQAFEKLLPWQKQITLDVVHAVCEGMETDLQVFPPETAGEIRALPSADELEKYCRLMGGAPGVFWSKLISHTVPVKIKETDFWTWGQAIGDALQIVNILRDLPRDLRIGRCYFPEEELQKNGLTAADLLQPGNSPRFEPVKQYWIRWGRQKLQYAKLFYGALPKTQPTHRAAVAWPALWAADTLNKIAVEPALLDPGRRVKIPRARIYGTMCLTPLILLSNTLFNAWLQSKLDK